MNNQALTSYLSKLTHLNPTNTLYGKASIKPILFIQLIKKEFAQNKRIYVNTGLLSTFHHNWRLLVNALNQSDFIQPNYYMQFRFYPNTGREAQMSAVRLLSAYELFIRIA